METLLVVGSGTSTYREYAFRELAARYTLLLINNEPLTWQAPYVVDAAQAIWSDMSSILRATDDLRGRYDIDGVFTFRENTVEATATIAESLGLPHNSLECARQCRDKLLMRQAWERYEVPSARCRVATSLEEASIAAQEIGYPVVLKPQALAGSVGVMRIDSPDQLNESFAIAHVTEPQSTLESSSPNNVLVEEFLAGPEISVESVVVNGQVHVVAMTRKTVGFAPFFEELGHAVSPGEPLSEEAAIRKVVLDAHRALGIRMGVTHAELKLTPSGPHMIEIGARAAGDLIPLLVSITTNVELTTAGAEVALGRVPDTTPQIGGAAAIRFIYPDYDSRIEVMNLEQEAAHVPWLYAHEWEAKVGDELHLPPRGFMSRIGFTVVTGATIAECEERQAYIRRYIHVDLTPL